MNSKADQAVRESCIFCALASGRESCISVADSPTLLAFMDANPIRPGHVVVMPRKHTDHFSELDEETYHALMGFARRLAGVMQRVYSPLKVALLMVGLEVTHTHVHLVPLRQYGDLMGELPEEARSPPALAQEAERIRAAIAETAIL